jgi:hypothetical protein
MVRSAFSPPTPVRIIIQFVQRCGRSYHPAVERLMAEARV